MDKILAAAQTIATARRNRTPLASLPPELAPEDEAEGYRVQRAVHDLLLPKTGSLVGYKIGCTSAVMQQYLDIPHPCGGGVFAKGVHDSGAKLRFGDYVRVGVECEIAVRLARNLSPSEAPFTAEWVMEAIEAYYPAIEIVDDRYVKWETMGAPTLVADDFFAAGCVLGKAVARTKAPDLLKVAGRAIINGEEAGRGTGADVLGHPHNALAWLANHLAEEGKGLHAGQIVLTGSLVKTVWLNAGDSVKMELDGLGTVKRSSRELQGGLAKRNPPFARRMRWASLRSTHQDFTMQWVMAESVPSVLEADAAGEIADIYADIRKVLGTSVVNLIWRNLATMPGALQWTWSTVRPLYLGDAPLHAEAVRRTIALPDWPAFPPTPCSPPASTRPNRRSFATCSTAINIPTRSRWSFCRRCWRITNRGRPMPSRLPAPRRSPPAPKFRSCRRWMRSIPKSRRWSGN